MPAHNIIFPTAWLHNALSLSLSPLPPPLSLDSNILSQSRVQYQQQVWGSGLSSLHLQQTHHIASQEEERRTHDWNELRIVSLY